MASASSAFSIFSGVFSQEDIEYLRVAVEQQIAQGKTYLRVPLTESVRNSLEAHLGLDLDGVSEIPMRWIQGDTVEHIDRGASQFENTYLVYLNDSPGQLILDTESYPIRENTAFIFNEGLTHKTVGAGPRLLVGPMNEFAEPVGLPTIYYYNNYYDAFNSINFIASGTIGDLILGNVSIGSIGSYTTWRVARPIGIAGVYSNGFNFADLDPNTGYNVYPSAPCFLEGTGILCQVDGKEAYVPIENLKPGALVKTSLNGYKAVKLVGKGQIKNPGTAERTQNRLYKCSLKNYPELQKDLFITGCHSILVDSLSESDREQTEKVYVTDRKYRLMAYIDQRSEPWTSEGLYTIWHLALENADERMNYGIYAEGLLVESCSINFLKNHSNMSCTS
jgi:hypothetical protein